MPVKPVKAWAAVTKRGKVFKVAFHKCVASAGMSLPDGETIQRVRITSADPCRLVSGSGGYYSTSCGQIIMRHDTYRYCPWCGQPLKASHD